jgi:hypothetical protein
MNIIFPFPFPALYREVATPDEVVGEGNFFPRIAENADDLIDYALTFIPKSTSSRYHQHLFPSNYKHCTCCITLCFAFWLIADYYYRIHILHIEGGYRGSRQKKRMALKWRIKEVKLP